MAGYENFVTDEIIKRRLLIDGDGAGDDRKMLALTRNFVNFCNTSGESKEEVQSTLLSLLCQLNQVEFIGKRTHHSIVINENTKETYDELKSTTLTEISQTKDLISKSKNLLEEAVKFRKHSMEYDALAKLIETKPDRKQTEAKQKDLLFDLDQLKKKKQEANDKLDSMKKKFQVLTFAISMLQDSFDDEGEKVAEGPASRPQEAETESPMDIDVVAPPNSENQGKGPSISLDTSDIIDQISGSPISSVNEGTSNTKVDHRIRLDDRSQNYEDLSDEGEA